MNALNRESYISVMSNKVKQFGGINLAQGLPGFDPPAKLLTCLTNAVDTPVHQYPPATGNFKLVNHIQNDYSQKLNSDLFSPIVTCGATEAISLIYNYIHLQLNSIYSVLSFNPAYESYRRLPELYHIPFISFGDIENTKIDFQKLTSTIVANNVKIIFFAPIGNPYGKAFSDIDISLLIEFSEKNDLFLIIDDVYSDLYFKTKTALPFDKFYQNCFLVNSFSKRFSITGWRLGYLFAHHNHFSKIKNLHDYTGLCAPSILQEAVANYLSIPNDNQYYVAKLRDQIAHNYISFSNELKKLGFYIPPTDGGYFIWTKLPSQITDGVDFAIQLFESQKIAVVPGIHFSDDATRWIRINIARSEFELISGIQGVTNFINSKFT